VNILRHIWEALHTALLLLRIAGMRIVPHARMAVATRGMVRLLHALVEGRAGAEHGLDELEQAAGRLSVEEEDDDGPRQVQTCEEEVGARLHGLSDQLALDFRFLLRIQHLHCRPLRSSGEWLIRRWLILRGRDGRVVFDPVSGRLGGGVSAVCNTMGRGPMLTMHGSW
jgi:hypothetical protein